MFSPEVYKQRATSVQSKLQQEGLDYLLIGPGANLFYFTGIEAHIGSRLQVLVVPAEGEPRLIVPALEKPAVESHATYFSLLPWNDSETSKPSVKAAFPNAASSLRCAVDDQMWAGHLLDLQSTLTPSTWVKGSAVIKSVRARKSADEIALMKKAASIADAALAELKTQPFAGRTERDIMTEIQRLLIHHGDESMSFCIVGSGPNSAVPHHNCSDRVIQKGEVVLLDFGGVYHGYQSDMTRVVMVRGGKEDAEFKKVYDTVNRARNAAHTHAKPGVTGESVDRAARKVIEDAGYGEYFIHRTGHGLGIDLHEDPYIIPGNQELLEEGNVFSIEPGIYLPGKFGVRIEDICIITADGEENINLSSHELEYVD